MIEAAWYSRYGTAEEEAECDDDDNVQFVDPLSQY